MQVCCYYWGRNLRAEEKGRHGQGSGMDDPGQASQSQLLPFWMYFSSSWRTRKLPDHHWPTAPLSSSHSPSKCQTRVRF